MDATIEKELGDKAGVQGFPTIKFYKNDNKVEYTGGRDTDQIISWLKKMDICKTETYYGL